MNLDEFLHACTRTERREFYAAIALTRPKASPLSTRVYVHSVSRNKRPPGAKLAIDIEALTRLMSAAAPGRLEPVPRWELREDLWAPGDGEPVQVVEEPPPPPPSPRKKKANGQTKPQTKRKPAATAA